MGVTSAGTVSERAAQALHREFGASRREMVLGPKVFTIASVTRGRIVTTSYAERLVPRRRHPASRRAARHRSGRRQLQTRVGRTRSRLENS